MSYVDAKRGAILAVFTGVLASCATTPPTYPELVHARAAVTAVQSNPDAMKYAQLQVQKAADFLQQAEVAAKAQQLEALHHYAYLAEQETKIAQQNAAEKVADAHIATADTERQRVQLEVRARQVARAKEQAAAATEALKQAQAELADLHAKQTDRGTVITLGDVLFDTGRAELKPGAFKPVSELARFLREHPERRVLIEGFTDNVGGDDLNQALSQRRADTVRSALITQGIASDRIDAAGRGKDFPVASNDDASGRQLNRRVELTISDETGHIQPR
jgi:outer membrane protein OmpA-like peptidoglycan-associated protein